MVYILHKFISIGIYDIKNLNDNKDKQELAYSDLEWTKPWSSKAYSQWYTNKRVGIFIHQLLQEQLTFPRRLIVATPIDEL